MVNKVGDYRRSISPFNVVGIALLVILGAMLVHTLVINPRFEWPVVRRYMFSAPVLRGLWLTIWLTFVIMLFSTILGLFIALFRLSSNGLVRFAGNLYIWFFRGTPILVQLIFWFNLSALFPKLAFGIPFGPELYTLNVNKVVTPIAAAILAFALYMAAYQAEIIRGGILGVDEGQSEAAHALGYTEVQRLRRIIIPQAMRTIIPPIANETISMTKSTSLVSVISVVDLLHSVQLIYSTNYEVIPLLIVAALWYIVLVSILTIGQAWLEKRFAKGSVRSNRVGVRRPKRALVAPVGDLSDGGRV